MTCQRIIEITCMNCNRTQEMTIYESINVTLDPTLKEKLFKGEINIFQCHTCRKKEFIAIPLLYHDMANHIMVQYFPLDSLEDDTFLSQFSKEGQWGIEFKKGLPRKLRKLFGQVHIVFDMGELLRYVVFRDKLLEKWKESS